VKDYVNFSTKPKVTVIIPYKVDRGWLKDAIASIPEWVQLLVSQGEGNWPANFNKVLNQVTGDYIRWLHEDDMLTPNSIEDAVRAIEDQDVDFIHGNAIELRQDSGNTIVWRSPDKSVTLERLLKTNPIHSATLMYRKQVFDRVGKLDETLNTAEEYEFNLRCLKAGMRLGYCDSTLAIYRRHSKQKVRVVSKEERGREREMVRTIYR
jgi:GT2 family glycosyltransferase